MKRLSIEVSDALHKEAKLAAMVEGQTLSGLVIELLNLFLEERGVGAQPRRRATDNQMTSPGPCSGHVPVRR